MTVKERRQNPEGLVYFVRLPIFKRGHSRARREVVFAPFPVVGHSVESAEARIVQHGLIGVNEGVAQALFERAASGSFELTQPFRRDCFVAGEVF